MYYKGRKGDDMGIAQDVRVAAAAAHMSQSEVAREIGMTRQNFSMKMQRESFSEEEMRKIAQATGTLYQPERLLLKEEK